MTLFSVSGRARVTDVKVKASASAGTEIVVGVAFRRSELTEQERSALMDYHGAFVDVELAAVQRDADDAPRPMEKLWTGDDAADPGQPERMRPGETEQCIDCAKVIGDDPEAGFHVPLAGPPSPLCGACVAKRQAEDAAADDAEGAPDPTDPANQSWCPECRIWLAVPTGGICEVCGTGTTSEATEEPEKADWQRIADGEDLEAPSDSGPSSEGEKSEEAESDQPIGDRPLPTPEDRDPVGTTPTRRRR